ncbi:MAG TPA: 4'-phosphopantetheinyl transferase superfamily protein [Thermoanaerobaculia bacterium]
MKHLVLECDGADVMLFSKEELAIAASFKLAKRRDEWLCSRTAVKRLAASMGLEPLRCTVARPMLLVDGVSSGLYVSLSHSGRYAAAVLAEEPVGIDIEMLRDLDENAAHLYLTESEEAVMRGCALPYRSLHFWCAKEAAFKARSPEFVTLKQLPLTLIAERADGLVFDGATTQRYESYILAIGTIR